MKFAVAAKETLVDADVPGSRYNDLNRGRGRRYAYSSRRNGISGVVDGGDPPKPEVLPDVTGGAVGLNTP